MSHRNTTATGLSSALLLALFSLCAQADDLGTKAATYTPDADGRDQFKAVVRRKAANGELQRFWEQYRARTLEAIEHPAPLPIASSYAPRSVVKPAAFTLPADYRDHTGRVIARKGTVIEPLKRQPLSQALLFIDGRDATQVAYAVRQAQAMPLKVVLTGGSAVELRRQYRNTAVRGTVGIPFYWDQKAAVTNGLKRLYGIEIQSVPALLSQQGSGLRIDFGMTGAKP